MSCPHWNNAFCAKLPGSVRETLCSHCHLRKYAKGQRLHYRSWENLVAALLEGVMVLGETDPGSSGRFTTSGPASRGTLLSPGPLIDVWSAPAANREVLCLMDCTVAVFDTGAAQELFDSQISFVKEVYGNLMEHCCYEKELMMRSVGNGDAYHAVRYVLDYCRRYGIPSLTHEQVALICNRSRPTVTEVMHSLLRKEPQLFLPLSSLP